MVDMTSRRSVVALLAALATVLCASRLPAVAGEVAPGRMPIVEVATQRPGDTMGVFYSGDGGWGPLDQVTSEALAKAGVPVVGVNALRYFWTRRTAEGAAADLSDTLLRYSAAWRRPRVILIGYSFGADALPAIVPHLAPELRRRVRLVALVGMGARGELEFRPKSWFGAAVKHDFAVPPLLAQLTTTPLVCIYGDHERADACPGLPSNRIRQVRLQGGHHFDGHYAPIARAILSAAGAG